MQVSCIRRITPNLERRRVNLSQFSTMSFDCYGTLIDWESGILAALKTLLHRAGLEGDPEQLLQRHGRIESEIQQESPGMRYPQVLETVCARLADDLRVAVSPGECRAYGRSVANWPAFPDAAESLRYLKHYYRLVILSNVDRASFASSNRLLQVEFDDVFTAEDIGSYKPDLRNFHYLIQRLDASGVRQDHILHTAESLFHDHAPANAMGLASCWIWRRHAKPGSGATRAVDTSPRYDFRFNSLAALVDAHRLEPDNR
jgi:2-haloalkanoic acid dehalogenase type II